MLDLAVRAQKAAAIGFHFARPGAAHKSELDREPEESRHRAQDARQLLDVSAGDLNGCMGAFSEAYQRVGKVRIGMHRHVSGDVMEDVGLG